MSATLPREEEVEPGRLEDEPCASTDARVPLRRARRSDCSFDDTCELAETDNRFAKGKTVLIGMPGAFTPTCTDAHLPGYIRNARRFKRAGVTNLAVVTTNDRFIMTAWKRKMRECAEQEGMRSIDSQISMLADKGGNLIKALGMAYAETLDRKEKNSFIQLNAGMRSK